MTLFICRACAQVIALVAIAMLFNSWILYVASIQHGVCDIDPSFDRIYHVMTVLEVRLFRVSIFLFGTLEDIANLPVVSSVGRDIFY